MDIKKFLVPIVGLNVVDVVSAAKIRFARCCGESLNLISIVGGSMENSVTRKIQSLLLILTLTVTAFWVSLATVTAQEMVKDPATGEMVEAPRYGGTITYPQARGIGEHADLWYSPI